MRPDGARAGQVLVAVADGMGGHKAGEVASALAIASLRRALDDSDAAATSEVLLTEGAMLGNRTIWEQRPPTSTKKAWARPSCAPCSPPTARR